MDLIYTDQKREDIGCLHDYSFDLAFGSNENDFEIKVDILNHVCKENGLIYIEETEYGGIIDKIGVNTANSQVTYKGRTWHGILATKIICPDSGADYLLCTGDLNVVLQMLIERIGLEMLFKASVEPTGVILNNYKMQRYINAYDGIKRLLENNKYKLHMYYQNQYVQLEAIPLVDYSVNEELDADCNSLEAEKNYNQINHIVCLGRGELKERQVIHFYADRKGNISKRQTLFGLDEYVKIYENTNAESIVELEKEGVELLISAYNTDKIDVKFEANSVEYDIGDIVGATEEITKLSIKSIVIKKIITITNENMNIQYEVGEK